MRILVIDDEASFRQVFAEILAEEGHDVREAEDGATGLALAADVAPDVVVVDWMLGGGASGPALARELRDLRPDVGLVFVTGYHADDLREVVDELAAQVLQKPFGFEALAAAVQDVAPSRA